MSKENSSPRPLCWMTSFGMASDGASRQGKHELLHGSKHINKFNLRSKTLSQDEPKDRVRRRARKRRGPPQLQFLTVTDHAEFKGGRAQRSVRSQAMMQYRYELALQKRQKSKDKTDETIRSSIVEHLVPIGQANGAIETTTDVSLPRAIDDSLVFGHSQPQKDRWNAHGYEVEADSSWEPHTTAMALAYSPEHCNAFRNTTAIVCAHVPIVCESMPLPELCRFQIPYCTIDSSMMLPESLLYCPREQMFSVMTDPACFAHTYELLCRVRDLTDLFLTYSDKLTCGVEEEQEFDEYQLRSLSADYDKKVAHFRTKLASIPSAYMAGLPSTNDWIYEACRITALIYTSAVMTCVPFSVAAHPEQNAIVHTVASNSENISNRPLTDSLYEVLERTNTGDL
ncbi:hypothetical protein BU23DRAFT_151034 [Bimuria novae-zelandiae CBS 107.79]|uniref:Uncharacterized protein n=1 Tax=Bimuria novae-zelandiae CBS 107.79 TaxID=1447943 RepID=A0A6A5VU55_9PLEO|nr:hypothetical protein BU23DRAFT_151034 [Bimuria novae-zelandiae CBS 107.79]